MRVLVIGADGFIGRAVVTALDDRHEILAASRSVSPGIDYRVDLADPATIMELLARTRPDAIVNCAGVVVNTEAAKLNVVFTTNLLKAVVTSGRPLRRLIVCGSAAEYGRIRPQDLPVAESTPLHPVGPYAESKVQETRVALEYGADKGLPVVVVRIFNPLGAGMAPRYLVASLVRQLAEVAAGKRAAIEVSRLDSKRDYVDVRDIASGIRTLIEHEPRHVIYNLGSGRSTSNAELIALIEASIPGASQVELVETAAQAEPLVAVQADIARMTDEFGWVPQYRIEQTVEEIRNAIN